MPGLDFPGGIFSFSAMGTNFSRIFRNWINPTVAWDVILIWRKDRGSSANLFKWSIRPNLEQEREKTQKVVNLWFLPRNGNWVSLFFKTVFYSSFIIETTFTDFFTLHWWLRTSTYWFGNGFKIRILHSFSFLTFMK